MPTRRPTVWTRAIGMLGFPVRRVRTMQPRARFLWLLTLTLLLSIAVVSAGLAWRRERETRRESMLAENRRRLERAAALHEVAAAEALLVQQVEWAGSESAAARRLESLRRGEADSDDPAIARLTMTGHLNQARWVEAAREAEKLIAAAPDDMLARSLLARQALTDGRPGEARDHLDAVPSPFDKYDSASPAALLLFVRLKRELGQDPADAIAFMATRLLPILRSRQAEQLPPAGRWQLVHCYHEAGRSLEQHPELAELWMPATRLIDLAGQSPEQAATVAAASEEQLALLDAMQRIGRVPPADAAELRVDVERQIERSWQAAQQHDPKDPRPYAGLALAARRRNDEAAMRQWLQQGIESSGDARSLQLLTGRMLLARDPSGALEQASQTLANHPSDLAAMQLAAEAAMALSRFDLVVAMCQRARLTDAALAWACRLEAAARLGQRRPTLAMEALAGLKSALPRDAAAMELYARAALAIGAESLVDELLAKDDALAGQVGAARGFLSAGRHEEAAARAGRLLEAHPEDAAIRRVHAEALRLVAEAGDAPKWEAAKVRAAIDAYDWLRRRDTADPRVAQRIARLELIGLAAPAIALRSVKPLRDAPLSARSVEMNETLGAVLIANGVAGEALLALDAVVAKAPARAGGYIARASAYEQLGRRREAAADLERALKLPRSPRETAHCERIRESLSAKK